MYQHTEQPQSRIEVEHAQARADMSREFDRQPEHWNGWIEPAKPRNRINLVEVKYPNNSGVVIIGFWRTDGILEAYPASEWQHIKVIDICLNAGLEYNFEIDADKTITLSFWRA